MNFSQVFKFKMPICYLSMYLTMPFQACFSNWGNRLMGEGFTPHKQEFLSIAARIGDQSFWRWIMPVGEISPAMTRTTLVIKWEGKLVNKETLNKIAESKVGDSRTTLSKLITFMSANAKDSQGNFEPVDVVVYSGFSGLFDLLVHSLVLHGICTESWRKDLIGRMSEIKETAWFLKRPKAPVMGYRQVGGAGMIQMIQILS